MITQQVALVQIFIYTCTDTLYATRNELCEIISYKITVCLHCFSYCSYFAIMWNKVIELTETATPSKKVSLINRIATIICISSLDEKVRIESGTIDLRFNLHKYVGTKLAGREWLISPSTKELDYVVLYDRE